MKIKLQRQNRDANPFFSNWIKQLFLFVLLFYFGTASASLANFTLTVTKTDETCTGNGTLNFVAASTDAGSTFEYRVYKFPDITNAIAVLATNTLGGLIAGNYRVVATRTLAGVTDSLSEDVTIDNLVIPLAYTISSTNATCGADGSMQVTVFSGTGLQYEIISGPVTMPLQSSPVFNLLPAGIYQIRVFDSCGEGWVASHTLFSNVGDIEVSPATFEDSQLQSCNSIFVTNTLSVLPSESIAYPLTVQYTVSPPGGGTPTIINSTVVSGGAESYELTTEIPFYHDVIYLYDLHITDGCGNVFIENDILVNLHFVSEIRIPLSSCGQHFINFASINYVAPLTITFTDFPAGFDPALFNSNHPGPFVSDSVDYGTYQQPVPFGHYEATVTDACGRTYITEAEIEFIPAEPAIEIQPYAGCESNFSDVLFEIPGYQIVGASIIAGPASYSATFPVNNSQFILPDHTIEIPHLPTGNYTIVLTDECGNTYQEDFIVPNAATMVTYSARTGCEPGFGSIRIRGTGTNIISAIITSAPTAFGQTLPFNATSNISTGGIFSMASLPPGTYVVDVIDSCNISHTVSINVIAYQITENTYSLTEYCGAFDLTFHHNSNASVAPGFWLQKLDTLTNQWGHPETGVAYVEGTVPSPANSYIVTNNVTNYNISYLGHFRITKVFESYNNGSVGPFKPCIEVIQDFIFNNDIEIIDIQKTTCNGQFSDVSVTAVGLPPLTYQINLKDGLPFFLDNGSNNVFPNLEAGVYNFLVYDACGNVANRLTDVALLPSLANAADPEDINSIESCDEADNDLQADFDLSQQNAAVLAGQNPAGFTITYHISLADAGAGINPLPVNYYGPSGTIYARLLYNNGGNCYDITYFDIIVKNYPIPAMDTEYPVCAGSNVTISAGSGFDTYLWSTNETGPSITVDEPGQYWVELTQGNCTGIFNFEVTQSQGPSIDHIETTDWTAADNTITVVINNPELGNYQFSLDNNTFQASNIFEGLSPGIYTVYVKDLNGCGDVEQQVYLLNYPHYFTPNGDGYHDFWHIPYSMLEPDMEIFIFDRYGKLITGFKPDSPGWDGTLNGQPLPSTDYWFKVTRQSGKEHLGHFAMKR